MKTFLAAVILFGVACLTSQAQQVGLQPTTPEAQAFADAMDQTTKHTWSFALLAFAQMAAAMATLSLLVNMRTLAFAFLFIYGLLILNVPYYVPDKFKLVFGAAIVLMSIIGILWRVFVLVKPRRVTPAKP